MPRSFAAYPASGGKNAQIKPISVLAHRRVSFERQVGVSVFFREIELGFHRLDLLVNGELIVELKAMRRLEDVHFAIVRSYLRAFSLRHALLFNFGKRILEIKRVDESAPALDGGSPQRRSFSALPRGEAAASVVPASGRRN
ncbi:GxxExxY protein [Myxococcota bacterium]